MWILRCVCPWIMDAGIRRFLNTFSFGNEEKKNCMKRKAAFIHCTWHFYNFDDDFLCNIRNKPIAEAERLQTWQCDDHYNSFLFTGIWILCFVNLNFIFRKFHKEQKKNFDGKMVRSLSRLERCLRKLFFLCAHWIQMTVFNWKGPETRRSTC